MLRIGGKRADVAARIGRHDLAVVAAGDETLRVAGRRQDRAAMKRDTPLLVAAGEQHGFLAQHEGGGVAEELNRHDRAFGLVAARALDDGGDVAGLAHAQPINTGGSCHAALEAGADLILGQVAADEHDAAGAPLTLFPFPLVVAVEDHVHALEHEARRIVLEGQDALAAQDAGTVLLHQVLHPREELVRIERRVQGERDRLHLLVVIVAETAMLMRATVMMIVIMMIVVMIIMVVVVVVIVAVTVIMSVIVDVIIGLEELRLEVENAIEVEGLAAEHLGERQRAALRPVQPRIGIDAADARLDVGELGRRRQDRSC